MDFPFKAKSYTANKKYLYGYSIDITRPFLDNRTALATCLEYICSDVMNNGSLINNTYIVIKPIGCQFLKSGHDLYQGQYPYPLPHSTRSGSFHMRRLTAILFNSCPGFVWQSEYFAWDTTESGCRTGDLGLGCLIFWNFFRQALLNITIVHELVNADWANLGIWAKKLGNFRVNQD